MSEFKNKLDRADWSFYGRDSDISLLLREAVAQRSEIDVFEKLANKLQKLTNAPSLPDGCKKMARIFSSLAAAVDEQDTPVRLQEALDELRTLRLSVQSGVFKAKDTNAIAELGNDASAFLNSLGLTDGNEYDLDSIWMLWDIWSQLRRFGWKADGSSQVSVQRTASVPVLIFDDGPGRGRVFRFHVELLKDGGPGGCLPDLFKMGLLSFPINSDTTNREGPGRSFVDSIQHAWAVSKLGSLGYRCRWSLGEFSLSTEKKSEVADSWSRTVDHVKGRSAEAAACVAMWAAAGGVPGRDEPLQNGAEDLDPRIAVSAKLGNGDGPDTLIHQIAAEYDKCRQAFKIGVETVVFAKPQEREKNLLTGHNAASSGGRENTSRQASERAGTDVPLPEETLTSENDGTIERLETIDEVYCEMLVVNRYVRRYQEQVRRDWLAQWSNKRTAGATSATDLDEAIRLDAEDAARAASESNAEPA